MPTSKELQNACKGHSKDEIFDIIDQYIHNERDRALLKRRLHDRISIEALSEEFSMSPRRCFDVLNSHRALIILQLKKET